MISICNRSVHQALGTQRRWKLIEALSRHMKRAAGILSNVAPESEFSCSSADTAESLGFSPSYRTNAVKPCCQRLFLTY